MYSYKVVPLAYGSNSLIFGITTNTSQAIMQNLQQRFGEQQVTFQLISDSGYRDYMKLYDPPQSVTYQDITLGADQTNAINQISTTLSQVRADDMLAYVVQQAFKLGASDIHLETGIDKVRIRFRVHGVLHPIAELNADKYRQLISALASAANVSTSADYDQTGHINREYKLATGESVTVNIRVETVPAINGIDAVLRLFNFNRDRLHLDKLGLTEYQSGVVGDIIKHPTGLVLIVGPTGSGKTTTLYSLINELNTPERKIITLEDPVEYQIEGITQIPVNSRGGQSFSEKFRAVMRLDPDIIMVGEIRDIDTAKTALQAALTGHLVLSTYHANDAASALTRLLDAIGENPLYSNAIKLIQAQRLVRKLDDSTKQEIKPDDATLTMLDKIVASFPEKLTKFDPRTIKYYKPGASAENPFGFNDQIAVRELMLMTPEMMELLRKPAREVTTDQIKKVAESTGMITLLEDGISKVAQGQTTLEEIFRVID
jgi:type II secretory ATPase GspE/PulE/Tfp pilus assembly ATPase PilB-like protein